MDTLRWLWHELVRPRGPRTHRFYRVGRSSRSGVALLMVMTTLLLMTILSANIQFGAVVRLKLAAHQRDEVKAEALARSGVEIGQLLLVVSQQLDDKIASISAMLPPGAQEMINMFTGGAGTWKLVSMVNTGLLRELLVTGGDADELEGGDPQSLGSKLSEEQIAESREGSTTRKTNFLDFDGDFFMEVTDEDSRINITRLRATDMAALDEDPVAQRLMSLMSGRENCAAVKSSLNMDGSISTAPLDMSTENDNDQFFYDRNIERRELIANLADWVDPDDRRIWQGGDEDALYENLPDPYKAKNAPFDSMQEVRLVDGWQDDEVWERFGDRLTVYGAGLVNVNSAECEVIWALLKTYLTPNDDQTVGMAMRAIETHKSMGGSFTNAQQFTQALTRQDLPFRVQVDPKLTQAITTKSKVFRVHTMGQVGDAAVTIDAVIDFSSMKTGKIVYWRMQ